MVSDIAPDDISRNVFCILGIPVDAIGMPAVIHRIERAAASKTRFLISTPNLNFLVNGQSDTDFREALLLSDLCPADGMPIVWLARMLGVPIKARVAGSDIFDALKAARYLRKPLNVFLFGGAEGVAKAAGEALNTRPGGLHCKGSLYPGFGSIADMSRSDVIDNVNASGADFLVASLGAKKGQLWLLQNHNRVLIPVRAHLGASLNFEAGTVGRAPEIMRRFGFEWLWRIKEEPYLWRRYWNDGSVLLRLLITCVLPLAVWTWWLQLRYRRVDFGIELIQSNEAITVRLAGPATAQHMERVIPIFRSAIASKKHIRIDFSDTCVIDARFLGLLLWYVRGSRSLALI